MSLKTDLDNVKSIRKMDAKGMYDLIYNFPQQLTEGAHLGFIADLKLPDFTPQNIILTGMGGSAIGGDLARSYLTYELKVPFTVCRNYLLPEYVNDKSLVFVSSYSGETEETLSAFQEAKRRKAKIIAITSGGTLFRECNKDGFPFILIPKGFPPRAALGYSFTPILITLSRLGLIQDKTEELEKTSKFLEDKRAEYALDKKKSQNPSKHLAAKPVWKTPHNLYLN